MVDAGLGFALVLLMGFALGFLGSVGVRSGSRILFFRIFAICKGVHGGYLLLFSHPTLPVTYEEICIDM